ncbi:MAG: hypothetical protein ACYDBJ_29115, partial [Aggregatilineales bacterium]
CVQIIMSIEAVDIGRQLDHLELDLRQFSFGLVTQVLQRILRTSIEWRHVLTLFSAEGGWALPFRNPRLDSTIQAFYRKSGRLPRGAFQVGAAVSNPSGAKAVVICSDAGCGGNFYGWGGDERVGDGFRTSATLNG